MIAQYIGFTRNFVKAWRIGDYGQLNKISCGINRQARVCAIHEFSGFKLQRLMIAYSASMPSVSAAGPGCRMIEDFTS